MNDAASAAYSRLAELQAEAKTPTPLTDHEDRIAMLEDTVAMLVSRLGDATPATPEPEPEPQTHATCPRTGLVLPVSEFKSGLGQPCRLVDNYLTAPDHIRARMSKPWTLNQEAVDQWLKSDPDLTVDGMRRWLADCARRGVGEVETQVFARGVGVM